MGTSLRRLGSSGVTAASDALMNDLILYVKTGCPYCMKVFSFARYNGIEFELRNIAEPGIADELIARGGKRQVPYLVDAKNSTEMYESDDIVEYLKNRK